MNLSSRHYPTVSSSLSFMAIPQVSIPSGSSNINTLKRMASAGLSDSETTRQTNGSSELMARVTRLRGSGLDNRRRKRKKRKVSVTKALASSLKTLVVSPSTPSSSGSLKGKERERELVDGTSLAEEATESHEKMESELVELRERLKQQAELLDQHKALLDALSPSLTCQICLEPMHRPYALAPCGHTACYTCLLAWFRAPPAHITFPPPHHLLHNFDPEEPALLARGTPMLLRKEKTCPHCRAIVSEAPVESWAVKDTVGHLFSRFDTIARQLYPGHERPTSGPTVTGSNVEAWNGVFKAALKKRSGLASRPIAYPDAAEEGVENRIEAENEVEGELGFWDEEDQVFRCTECLHEIFEGFCSDCGRQYAGHANEEDGGEWFTEDEVAGGLWFDRGLDGDWHDEDADLGDDHFQDPDDDDNLPLDLGIMERVFGRQPQYIGNPRHDEEGYESSFIDDEEDDTQNEHRGHDDDDDEYHSAEDDEANHGEDDRPHMNRARRSMDAYGRTRMPGGLADVDDEDEDDDEHGRSEQTIPASVVPRRRVLRLIDSEDESQSHSSEAENVHEQTNINVNENTGGDEDEEEASPHWSRALIPRLRNRLGTLLTDSDDASGSDHEGDRSDDQRLARREQRFISDRGYVRSSQENLTDSEDDDSHDHRHSRESSDPGRFFDWSRSRTNSDDDERNVGTWQTEEEAYYPNARHIDIDSNSGGSHYGDAFSDEDDFD